MKDAQPPIERIVNEEMAWLRRGRQQQALDIAISDMRRHEAEFRISRATGSKPFFFDEYKKFNKTFGADHGRRADEGQLERQVKTYADTFADWIASADRMCAARRDHRLDTRQMLPVADQIIASAAAGARPPPSVVGVADPHPEHHHRGRLRRRPDRSRASAG